MDGARTLSQGVDPGVGEGWKVELASTFEKWYWKHEHLSVLFSWRVGELGSARRAVDWMDLRLGPWSTKWEPLTFREDRGFSGLRPDESFLRCCVLVLQQEQQCSRQPLTSVTSMQLRKNVNLRFRKR